MTEAGARADRSAEDGELPHLDQPRSIFDLVNEEIESIGKVRVICNADLDPGDINAAKQAREQLEQLFAQEREQAAQRQQLSGWSDDDPPQRPPPA